MRILPSGYYVTLHFEFLTFLFLLPFYLHRTRPIPSYAYGRTDVRTRKRNIVVGLSVFTGLYTVVVGLAGYMYATSTK